MNLYGISDMDILEASTNERTFQRGRMYYYNKRVTGLDFNSSTMEYSAKVLGSEVYDVRITADEDGEIDSFYCSCPAFKTYFGLCKHIVAFLFILRDYYRDRHSVISNNNKSIEGIFEYISQMHQSRDKREVFLEPVLIVAPVKGRLMSRIELYVGESRLYVVKNIKKFLKDFFHGKKIEFGKLFVLDPLEHGLSEKDTKVLDLAGTILEYEEQISYLNHGQNRGSAFMGKNLVLAEPFIGQFLSLYEGSSIKAIINGSDLKRIPVIVSGMPLRFCLSLEEDGILLMLDAEELLPVSIGGRYYYFNGAIYRISERQHKAFMPFLKGFYDNKMPYVLFPSSHREIFMSEVFPVIKGLGEVILDEDLNSRIYKEKLVPKILLDRYEEGIQATVEFLYGDVKINPFMREETKSNDERILIRDFRKEGEIANYFDRSGFFVRNGKLYLLDEDSVFGFIYNVLPEIQKTAEVYYSESFRKITRPANGMFFGSVGMDDTLGWLNINFEFKDIDNDEIMAILSTLKEKKKYYRLRDGSFLPLDTSEFNYLGKLINQLDNRIDDLKSKTLKLPGYRALYIDRLISDAQIENLERNKHFNELVNRIKQPVDTEYEIPEGLEGILRGYQKTGYKWLRALADYGLGGILADDMGLGKTLQVLTFIRSMAGRTDSPALVIAPSSLIYNWKAEAEKFIPGMKVVVVAGTQSERIRIIQDMDNADLVVTSYALIRNDIEMYEGFKFSYCFLDEAQHIKNHRTIAARTVKKIKAGVNYALTGTPIENSLSELWSIFDFILPGYLFSHSKFESRFEIPITRDGSKEAAEDLARHINPFILRRLKRDVLKELPEKIETYMTVELTNEQKKVYAAYLHKANGELFAGKGDLPDNAYRIKLLTALTRLRQICCHPSLFLQNYNGGSGKMLLFDEIVADAVNSGHRILVFSQFTGVLDLVSQLLDKKGIPYFCLTGSTPVQERIEIVRNFNEGNRSVFLISLKAGGTGLNLTGADTVIHFDPWWNPSVEEQATDRAHRIGQEKVVQVIKIITRETVEEKILRLQQAKKELIESVIRPGESLINNMTTDELRQLLISSQ
jgi:superfamily II DNA or RNA helicase